MKTARFVAWALVGGVLIYGVCFVGWIVVDQVVQWIVRSL